MKIRSNVRSGEGGAGVFAGGQVFTGTGPAMARDNPDA